MNNTAKYTDPKISGSSPDTMVRAPPATTVLAQTCYPCLRRSKVYSLKQMPVYTLVGGSQPPFWMLKDSNGMRRETGLPWDRCYDLIGVIQLSLGLITNPKALFQTHKLRNDKNKECHRWKGPMVCSRYRCNASISKPQTGLQGSTDTQKVSQLRWLRCLPRDAEQVSTKASTPIV